MSRRVLGAGKLAMKHIAIITFAACLALPVASQTVDKFELDFTFKRSDLTTLEGTLSVMDDIEREARTVCRVDRGRRGIRRYDQVCIDDITAKLVARIDDPGLIAAHADAHPSQVELVQQFRNRARSVIR